MTIPIPQGMPEDTDEDEKKPCRQQQERTEIKNMIKTDGNQRKKKTKCPGQEKKRGNDLFFYKISFANGEAFGGRTSTARYLKRWRKRHKGLFAINWPVFL